jgi:probable F420-dependent oxidoreductase
VRVGLALPQFDFSVPGERPLRWETVQEWAGRAERQGFSSLWLADHLFSDLSQFGGPRERQSLFDPIPALAAVARRTRTVRLGILVLCVPLRPPSVVAKALATLDVVAGGRLTVGLGAGWYEPEFRAAGVPFEKLSTRLSRLEEAITVLSGLFGGGPFTYRGAHWTLEDARCLPVPIQRPRPPLWLGGRSDALLRLAGSRADGWNEAWSSAPGTYRRRLAVLDAACEAAGRDPSSVTRSLGLLTLVGEDEADLRRRYERLQARAPGAVLDGVPLDVWRRNHLAGTVDQVREQVAAWADVGVGDLILSVGAVPFSVSSADDVEMAAAACSLSPPCPTSDRWN